MSKLRNKIMIKGSFILSVLLIIGCTATISDKEGASNEVVNTNFEIASDDYAELAENAIKHVANFEFDKWGEMMSDDIEYYFPDGDAGTRTVLKGKEAVTGWYKNWRETSGIEKMTYSNSVHVPVYAKKSLNYSGLTGVLVLSYFSNEMVYDGNPISVRMHFGAHFNDDKLIDRYYTYYDRTPIIESVNENILNSETEGEE